MLASVVAIAIAAVAGVGLLLGGRGQAVPNQVLPDNIGGRVHNTQETFDAGIAVNGVEAISADRDGSFVDLTVTGSVNLSGTAIDKHVKVATTIDADSIGNGSVTSSVVTATGASVGDSVYITRLGNWGASSSTINIFGVAGSNAVTLYFQNNSSTAVNLSEAVYNVDVWSH